jgi:hypothetical protein
MFQFLRSGTWGPLLLKLSREGTKVIFTPLKSLSTSVGAQGKLLQAWPRHSSSGYSLASHRDSPGLVMWYLWWTEWLWDRFSPSTSVFPANLHPTNFYTITITYPLGLVQ